jgi:hypothetical protein
MEARYVALLILVPFAVIFVYCTWHEYRRFKTEGRSIYGLSYDPETNTTHVGPIPEDEESFDPDDFDPDLLETEAKARQDEETADEDKSHAHDTDQPDTDDKPQDTRT